MKACTVLIEGEPLTTVREREKIRRAFSFYLSPDMIRRIQEDPESLSLGGEEVVGSALFTDIAGFTSTSEKMTAPETASMLNDYFSDITQTIFDTSGTLIKYIGDAVFAIYGALFLLSVVALLKVRPCSCTPPGPWAQGPRAGQLPALSQEGA